MTHQDMANVEFVSDIKELENLLNDSIAKQRVTLDRNNSMHWTSQMFSINNV